MKNYSNILVCGQCHSGKTHLIKSVCPSGTVPDEAVNLQTRKGFNFVVYETEFVNFIDAPGIELGEQTTEYWDNLKQKSGEHFPYDCVWYCIDGSKTTIQRGDIELLKLAGDKSIAIITNAEHLDSETQDEMIKKLAKVVPRERIITVSIKNETGLNKLLDCSKNMIYRRLQIGESEKVKMFEEWNNYFAYQHSEWSKNTTKQAEEYIYWGAGRAFVIAAVPFPMADLIPLITNEAYMVSRIGACYGYAVDKTMITSFIGCLGGSIAGKLMASMIPFLKAPIAAAVTYGVGRAAMAYFESDMTITSKELRDIFTFAKYKGENINWKAFAH